MCDTSTKDGCLRARPVHRLITGKHRRSQIPELCCPDAPTSPGVEHLTDRQRGGCGARSMERRQCPQSSRLRHRYIAQTYALSDCSPSTVAVVAVHRCACVCPDAFQLRKYTPGNTPTHRIHDWGSDGPGSKCWHSDCGARGPCGSSRRGEGRRRWRRNQEDHGGGLTKRRCRDPCVGARVQG